MTADGVRLVAHWVLSNWLALLGVGLGLAALIMQLRDRPRLRIVSIGVGFSGTRLASGEVRYNVHSVNVVVENRGNRPAIGCDGAVAFARMDGLILWPETREYVVNTKERHFDVQGRSKVALLAGWHLSPDGVIDTRKATTSPDEFLEKGLPVTVVISHEGRRTRGFYTKEEFRRTFEERQISMNLYEVR